MTDIIPQRRCKQCENEYPATPDYFPHGKGNFCITCDRAKERAYRAQHREARRAQGKAFYARNTEKVKAKSNAYRLAHPEEVKVRKHNDYIEHREEEITKRKARKEANREEYLNQKLSYRQRHKNTIQAYYRSHIEESRVVTRNRKAQKKANGGKHTAKDIERQFNAQKGKCYYCHIKLDVYHVDHIVPLSRGGSNDPSNLVIACPACNMSKGTKLLHEWLEAGRLL